MPPSLSLSLGRRSGGDVTGLDVQPGLVAAVHAHVNGAVLAERAVALPLATDTVREGDVVDADALSDTLRTLFASSRLSKRVRVGLANQRTVMRTLELPPVTDAKELAAAVQFQAQDQVPMPLANAVMDFQPLGIVDTPAGARQKVVLVAAQRDMVERLLAAVRGAGLTPIGLDMAAFALIRCLYRRDTNGAGRVLYLNVDGLTNVAIAEGTICRFTRVLGGGIEEIAASLAERTGMPLAHARGLLASVDLTDSPAPPPSPAAPAPPAPTLDVPALGFDAATAQEPHGPAGAESHLAEARPAEQHASPQPHVSGEAHLPAEAHVPPDLIAPPHEPSVEEVARSVLENGIRAIAGEVRNSIDFHRSQEGGEGVSRVMLSGAALELTGFAEVLEGALGVEVHSATVGLADGHRLEGASPHRFAVAAGLATTEVPQ